MSISRKMLPLMGRMNTPFNSRLGHSPLKRPSFQAFLKGGREDTQSFSPIRETRGFTVKGNVHVSTKVPILLTLSCPASIFRFIVSLAVWITVKTMLLRWTFAHVSKEKLKAIPSFADHYPFVIFVVWIGRRVLDAAQHASPAAISGRMPRSACMTMHKHSGILHASTRFSPSSSQRGSVNDADLAARTQTQPTGLPVLAGRGAFNDRKPSKYAPGYVFIVLGGWAFSDKIELRHLFSLTVESWRRAAGRYNFAAALL